MSVLTDKISRKRLDALVAPYASDGRVLEIGSYGRPGYGSYFPNRTGIDIKSGPGVDVVASVYELPFQDEEFDVVLCMSVLEHLKEPVRAISEMRRCLKRGGRIIISVPFLFPIHDAPGDFWRFTKYGLQELFHGGWVIEKLEAEADAQTSFAILAQRAGYQSRMRSNSVSKFLLFSFAKILQRAPRIFHVIYGDIKRSTIEKDAFASAFFLVASKHDHA